MTVLTESITLRKSNTGDFDRLYFLFTKELGKISALAKGACRPTSKLSTHLEGLSLSQVMLAEGKCGYRLAGAKMISANKTIKNDLSKIGWTSLFLEAIDRFLPAEEKDSEIFELTKLFIDNLSPLTDEKEKQILFNRYFFKMLDHFGYKPSNQPATQRELTLTMIKIVEIATDKKLNSAEYLNKLLN
jgi:DNA repair protein RecO (recombination protein O)